MKIVTVTKFSPSKKGWNALCLYADLFQFFLNRIHQNMELIPCLLSLLNKIWTLLDWRCNYLRHGSGLNRLFSDGQFLKMIHYVVRFCETQLRRVCTDGFTASRSCEPYIVTIAQLSLPLISEVNVHLDVVAGIKIVMGFMFTIVVGLSVIRSVDPQFVK